MTKNKNSNSLNTSCQVLGKFQKVNNLMMGANKKRPREEIIKPCEGFKLKEKTKNTRWMSREIYII